jgi:hypothetical protein
MPETSTKKHLSPTVYYLLAGMAMSWPCLIATGTLWPQWRQGVTLTPVSLAAIHLLILGSMLTVAFGVLYQIVPIAFQAPPLPRHVLFWHLPAHIISVLTMVAGFLSSRWLAVGCGGTLLLIAAAAYFVLLVRSYRQARNRTSVHRGLVWPFLALGIVLLIGLYQAFFPAGVNPSVILSHVLTGGIAFWGGLVLVISYKLVPMFAISHGYRASLARTAGMYFIGVLLLLASAWAEDAQIARVLADSGAILVLAALVSYAVDMTAIVRARKRSRLVLPLYDAFAAMAGFAAGLAWMMAAVLSGRFGWLYPAAYLFGFGGLLPLIYAYMQKIVPFLWFEYRFSKRPERKTAPLIDDMVPRHLAQTGVILYFAGMLGGLAALLAGGDAAKWSPERWASAAGMTLGSLLLFLALRRVLSIGGPPSAEEKT